MFSVLNAACLFLGIQLIVLASGSEGRYGWYATVGLHVDHAYVLGVQFVFFATSLNDDVLFGHPL